MPIHSTKCFHIEIRNRNGNLPIYFSHHKTAFFNVTPNAGIIKQKTYVRLKISFSPRSAIQGATYVSIYFQYYNQPKVDFAKLQVVEEFKIPVHVKVAIEPVTIKPKINIGITPMVTNEVGFLTDEVRFTDDTEKPIQAMVDLKFKESNAIIAFPNDRPKCLRPPVNKDLIV